MDDFKVGDIVGFRHLRNQPHRGVVVDLGAFKASGTPSVSVFWFQTAEKTRTTPRWLFKAEVEGV